MERRQPTTLFAGATAAILLGLGSPTLHSAAGGRHSAGLPAFEQARTSQAAGQAAVEPAKKGVEQAKKAKKDPVERFLEPWPDAATLRERKLEAENRPLFSSTEPIKVTLAADFKTVNKDRDRNSNRQYEAQFTVPAPGGGTKVVRATVGGRGALRRRAEVCEFIPLRLEFAEADVTGTLFDGLDHIKLVTHCQKDYEQYVLGEYLAYRVFNLFTPQSYRARLARATYVDSLTGRTVDTRWAIFIEEQDDVARRMEGRAVELPHKLFSQMVPDALLRHMVLQYMVGNTDFSIWVLHNIRLVQRPNETRLYPISYDFDVAGLVNGPYGTPDKKLPIKTIRDRYYRGPCVTADQLEPILAEFRPKKAETLALVDTIPGLEREYRQQARDYLDDFFATINDKGSIKRAFIDGCKDRLFM